MSDIHPSLEGFSFEIGSAGRPGKDAFIAASDRAPYFCFFGESPETVIALAERALGAYVNIKETSVVTTATEQHEVSVTAFQGERTVRLDELALA